MKKKLDESFKSKLLHIGRKNRFLRALIFPILIVTVFLCHLMEYLSENGKRLSMAMATVFIFAAFSSFSFPMFMTAGEEDVMPDSPAEVQAEIQAAQDIMGTVFLTQEIEINPEDIVILDDEDVLEGYEDAELHGMEDVDKYSLDEILESNENYKELSDKRESRQKNADSDLDKVFSKDDWRLVLINKQHPIPEDYTFELGTIKGNMQCDERIVDDLLDMLQEAKMDGINLVICSPYRDMERQVTLFNRKINRYMNKGMSYMDAYKLSSQSVTVPGASEHQIGMALDIVCDSYRSLDEGFGDTDAGKWLAENCAHYGFILRYPEGKEYITGIEYEPWHFRYVGVDAALIIMESGITLEEFWEDL